MTIIGITGGKGGTGKSTIATSLAYHLSKNNSVTLADADVECPDDDIMLGIEPNHIADVTQRIPEISAEECSKCQKCVDACALNAIILSKDAPPCCIETLCNGCGACMLSCPAKAISWKQKVIGSISGTMLDDRTLRVLSGQIKSGERMSEIIVETLLKYTKAKSEDHFILIDTSAGIHCPVISALSYCDTIIAVTEPTPLGISDLRRLIKHLPDHTIRFGVVLNRSDIAPADTLHEFCKEKKVELICSIPHSEDIASAHAHANPMPEHYITQLINWILDVVK